MTEAIEIKLDMITLRDDLRPRSIIDDDIVDEYRENIAFLPPILIAIDSAGYVLIDGWHRYRAHEEARRDTIMAILDNELKPEDFFFTAARANKAHGIRFDAWEKKNIAKRLFIKENRTAAEISDAVGCSVRHASELIRELAQEKKQEAIKLAKSLSTTGYSQRDIADELVKRGFKASKSGVDRWLKPEVEVPQIGESPKRDTSIEGALDAESEALGQEYLKQGTKVIVVSKDGTETPLESTTKTRVGVCPKCETRTVRVPSKDAVASCTKLFFYCDRCEEYIWIFRLQEKSE